MIGAPIGWLGNPQLFQSRILEEALKPGEIYARENDGHTVICRNIRQVFKRANQIS